MVIVLILDALLAVCDFFLSIPFVGDFATGVVELFSNLRQYFPSVPQVYVNGLIVIPIAEGALFLRGFFKYV